MNYTDYNLTTPIGDYFILVFAPVFVIQWIFWLISFALKTEKLYDIVGACTYLYVVSIRGFAFAATHTIGQLIQAGLIALWCIRLGGFLFYRVMKTGQDRRFEEIKKCLPKYFVAWTAQGLWITINTLPSCFMWWESGSGPQFEWRHGVGFAIFAFFWLFEVVSDFQKLAFKADPANNGRFIRTGLWRVSRHPNYFGEVVLWFGLFVSASVSFPSPWCFFSVLCPLWGTWLIVGFSGIPLLEASANKRWGAEAEYQEYVSETAVLVPFLRCCDPLCTPKPDSIAQENRNYDAVAEDDPD